MTILFLTAISTHTLTWSVTFRCLGFWGGLFISTHTLTWSVTCVVQISVAVQKFQLTRSRGAWLKSSCLAHAVIHFNSHAHVERDFYKSSPILTSFCISTHTLTWSVTKFITCSSMVSGISTHTLTWSVTGNNIQCIEKRQFQLTRSRGAWHLMLCISGACSTWCGLIFLFNGYRFDFVHCAFTNSMAFSCELTRDLWITWGTLVKILGRLQGHRSLWCRSVLLYASNCCLSNISADYHALGLLFSEVYLSLSEKCHSLRLFQTRCSALAVHNFDTLSTLFSALFYPYYLLLIHRSLLRSSFISPLFQQIVRVLI